MRHAHKVIKLQTKPKEFGNQGGVIDDTAARFIQPTFMDCINIGFD